MAIKEEIQFSAGFGDAVRSLNKFSKDASTSITGLGKTFGGLATLAKAAVAIFAGREVIRGINAVIDAAASQEEAVNKLNTALALAGDYSKEASEGMKAFATQMQATTKYEDDLILSQVALAKTFGLTNDKTQELVRTAADLASATGVSLDTAVDQLGKTLTGTAGTLGKTIPGLKDLSAESLKAGGAIDLITKRFGGAAAASVNTFGGAVAQLKNGFGDLLEEIGNAVVQNPVVLKGFQLITGGIADLTEFVIANADPLANFVGGLFKLGFEAIPIVLSAMKPALYVISALVDILLGAYRANINFVRSMLEYDLVKKVVDGLYRALAFVAGAISTVVANFAGLLKVLPGVSDTAADIEETFNGFVKSSVEAVKAGLDFQKVDRVLESVENKLSVAQEGAQSFTDSAKLGLQATIDYTSNLSDKLNKVNSTATQSTEIFEKLNESANNLSGKDFFTEGAEKIKSALNLENLFGSFSGAATGVMGAVNGVLDFAQQVIDFIPGVLSKLTKIFTSLTELPQKILDGFRELFGAVTKFITDYIPNLVRNFGALLADAVEFLAEGLPKAFETLIEMLPDILVDFIDKLPRLLPKLITGLINAQPRIAVALIDAFITKGGALKIGIAMAKAMAIEMPKAMAQGVKDSITQLGVNFGRIFSDNVKQAFTGIGSRIGNEFMTSIVEPFKTLFASLGTFFGQTLMNAIAGFGQSLLETIATAGQHFANAVRKLFDGSQFLAKLKSYLNGTKFVEKLKELFNDFLDSMADLLKKSNPFGGKGKGKSTTGNDYVDDATDPRNWGDGEGVFATGGLVPQGFPNDSFRARMSSGEMVIPRGDVDRLSQFLDGQERGSGNSLDINALANAINKGMEKNLTINISVAEDRLAQVLLNLNRQGFRTA